MDGSSSSIRRFLRSHYQATVSTLGEGGTPYASVVHYACDQQGSPWFLFSDLAVHSRYLRQDPRASLLVWDSGPDLMECSRAAFMGEIRREEPDPALEGRLMCLLPSAEVYLDMPDFHFYRLEIRRIRWIGGFGEMGWITAEGSVLLEDNPRDLALEEAAAVAHMNADHVEALRHYWQLFSGEDPGEGVRLLALDSEGGDLEWENRRLRFDFPEPVKNPRGWRETLATLAHRAVDTGPRS